MMMTKGRCEFCDGTHLSSDLLLQMNLGRAVPVLCTCKSAECHCGENLEQIAQAIDSLPREPGSRHERMMQTSAASIRVGVWFTEDDYSRVLSFLEV